MAEGDAHRRANHVAQRWQALARQRHEHLLEFYRSGRWRRYYTEEAFLSTMREAVRTIETWGRLADGGSAIGADTNASKRGPTKHGKPSCPDEF